MLHKHYKINFFPPEGIWHLEISIGCSVLHIQWYSVLDTLIVKCRYFYAFRAVSQFIRMCFGCDLQFNNRGLILQEHYKKYVFPPESIGILKFLLVAVSYIFNDIVHYIYYSLSLVIFMLSEQCRCRFGCALDSIWQRFAI